MRGSTGDRTETKRSIKEMSSAGISEIGNKVKTLNKLIIEFRIGKKHGLLLSVF